MSLHITHIYLSSTINFQVNIYTSKIVTLMLQQSEPRLSANLVVKIAFIPVGAILG